MKQGRMSASRLAGFLLIMFVPVFAFAGTQSIEGVNKEVLMKKVSGLQMPFIENRGQIRDKTVKFYANTFAGTVYVTDKGGIVYSLQKTEHRLKKSGDRIQNSEDRQTDTKSVAIKEGLQYAKFTDIKGIDRSVTRVNYFIGSRDKWRANIPTWQEVSLGRVYKGIGLKLRAYGDNVEKLFTVYPEGRVSDIKLKMEGAKGIKINKAGELEIETALGTVKMTKPEAYQDINGKRVQVAANYILPNSEPGTRNLGLTYGFQVGEYDKTRLLVIDPLLASTFIGGSEWEHAHALRLDSSGNVFIAGETESFNYPATAGAYDRTCGTDGVCNETYAEGNVYYYFDGFISKFDSNLSTLLSSTFIGGSDDDYAHDLAIDSSGNIFITGKTYSSDYPVTEGAYDTTYNGLRDVFVSRLDNNLSSLLSSTFIGGSDNEYAHVLAIDSSGNVFITGRTESSDYPVTEGAYDTSYNGLRDVFISRFDNNLSNLLSSTFIGGSDNEYLDAIGIDSSGNVFVAGGTLSDNYPTTPGAYDTTYNGIKDVFVSRLDNNLSSLLSSTYIGGSGYEDACTLTIDSSGNVFVAGGVKSNSYPTTPGAYDTSYNGDTDFFISKLNGNLSSLLSSTFIGGSGKDYVYAIGIDSSGDVFIAGRTESSDYPTTSGAYDTTNAGGDGFVSRLDSNLSSLLSSTFIGGANDDHAHALDIDSSGNVFVAGWTLSPYYPTTAGAYDTTYNGSWDVFVSKLDNDLSRPAVIVPVPDIKANGSDGPVTITKRGSLSLTISLYPGTYEGKNADWWVLMKAPSGWYHYDFETGKWLDGTAVSYQGPLYKINSLALQVKTSRRKGDYTYYFAVDTRMNGIQDRDVLYYDSVKVVLSKK